MLRKQYSIWIDYLRSKKLGAAEPWLSITENIEVMPSRHEPADLTLYFGVNDAITEASRILYSNRVTFATNGACDIDAGWANGYIWIAHPESGRNADWPDLKNEKVNRTMLLHELGHVIGVSHYVQTVMMSDIVCMLRACELDGCLDGMESAIDGRAQLVIPPHAAEECYAGRIARGPITDRIFGVPGNKPIEGRLLRRARERGFTLEAKNADGGASVHIALPDGIPVEIESSATAGAFQTIRRYGGQTMGSGYKSNFKVALARLSTESNEHFSVVIERNAEGNLVPVRIRVMDQGKVSDLFSGQIGSCGQ